MAPLPTWAVLGGKLLARFLVGVAQLWLLFAFGHLAFGMSLGRSLPALILLTLATVFAMTGFSLVVAAAARSREQIIPLGLTVIMVVCSLGGCWWPLYDMPAWLSGISHAFFTPWAMDGIHDVILRDHQHELLVLVRVCRHVRTRRQPHLRDHHVLADHASPLDPGHRMIGRQVGQAVGTCVGHCSASP